jgi:hypothetical protein
LEQIKSSTIVAVITPHLMRGFDYRLNGRSIYLLVAKPFDHFAIYGKVWAELAATMTIANALSFRI